MPETDSIKTYYQQACNWYHRIDDFRAKLLGLLPLISGGGIFLLLQDPISSGIDNYDLLAIGLFGFLITIGLLFYELRGVQRCIRITNIAKDIERSWNVTVHGPFSLQPTSLLDGVINEPIAASIIYPTVLAAWSYVALHIVDDTLLRGIISVIILLVSFGFIFLVFRRHLREDPNYKNDVSKEEKEKQAKKRNS